MPFLFDDIGATLDEQGKNKKNIFGQDEAPQGFGLTGGATDDKGAVEKSGSTTIIGAPSGGGASTQAPSVSEVQQPRGASEQRQAALESAGEKAPIPPSLAGLGESLSEKESALDTGADAYLNTFKQTDFGLDEDTIKAATTGDDEAFSKVAGLFSRGAPDIPDGFEVPDVTTPGIADIQTEGGLEQYLRRQAGPQYTAGEGSYDVATLARSPEFQQAITDLGGREERLGLRADDLAYNLPIQAGDILGTNLTTAQDAATAGLTGLQGGINQDILAALSAAQAERDALRLPGRYSNEAFAEAARAKSALADQTPDTENLDSLILGNELGLDPTDYYTVSKDPLTEQMVTTQSQADQLNKIAELLGVGGDTAVAGQLPEYSSFDTDAYQQALLEAARGYQPPVGIPPEVVPAETVIEPGPGAGPAFEAEPIETSTVPLDIDDASPITGDVNVPMPTTPPALDPYDSLPDYIDLEKEPEIATQVAQAVSGPGLPYTPEPIRTNAPSPDLQSGQTIDSGAGTFQIPESTAMPTDIDLFNSLPEEVDLAKEPEIATQLAQAIAGPGLPYTPVPAALAPEPAPAPYTPSEEELMEFERLFGGGGFY